MAQRCPHFGEPDCSHLYLVKTVDRSQHDIITKLPFIVDLSLWCTLNTPFAAALHLIGCPTLFSNIHYDDGVSINGMC